MRLTAATAASAKAHLPHAAKRALERIVVRVGGQVLHVHRPL